MFKKLSLFFILLFCFAILKADNFEAVKIISVYDGDTFKVDLPCTQDIFCKDIAVRIKGIDTPEIKTKNSCEKQKAKEAQTLTKQLLKSGTVVLQNCQRDKYFRVLCDVVILQQNQGLNLAEELLHNNLAVSYNGETKPNIDWCKTPKNQKSQQNILQEILEQIINIIEEIIKFIKNI